MCTVCGCGAASLMNAPANEVQAEGVAGRAHPHSHDHDHDHDHGHSHDHGTDHHHETAFAAIDFGKGLAGVSVPGLSQERTISIERDILAKNNAFADANRSRLREAGVFAINLLSSPGSGKTSLLVRAITDLQDRWPMAVIEGDQQTSNDADRIRQTGARAVQINTGKGCHLDAHMVGHALEQVTLEPAGLLFIENVGNLVCPAAFDLGEACKVVVLSVTEGEDKPLKYPDMFAAARLVLVNKIDLAPHVDADVALLIANARRVNPDVTVLCISARTGEGLDAWLAWLDARRIRPRSPVSHAA